MKGRNQETDVKTKADASDGLDLHRLSCSLNPIKKTGHAHHYSNMIFSTSHLLRKSSRQLGQALSGWAPPTSASHPARLSCRVLADPWRVCRNRGVMARRAMITYRAMGGYRCLRIFFKKNQSASIPSEHPPVKRKNHLLTA